MTCSKQTTIGTQDEGALLKSVFSSWSLTGDTVGSGLFEFTKLKVNMGLAILN